MESGFRLSVADSASSPRELTSQEIEDYRCFPILDGNIGGAVERADFYGTTLMEFKFAVKYYVLIMDDEVFCFPTLTDTHDMYDYLHYIQRDIYGRI